MGDLATHGGNAPGTVVICLCSIRDLLSGLVRLSQTGSPREAGRVPRRSCHDSSLWLMRRVFFRPWSCTCVGAPLRRDEALKRCWIRSAVPDSRRHSALAVKDCPGITVGGNGTWACGTTDQASPQTCPVSESGMGLSPCARKRECSPLGEGAGVLTMFHVKHGWTTAMRGQVEAGRGGVKGFRRQLAVVRVTRALRSLV